MTLICRILGHAALSTHYRNQGLNFAICARCGHDLIRREGEDDWGRLPQGLHVVWRRGPRASDSAAVADRIGAPPPRRSARSAAPPPRRNPAAPAPRERRIRGRVELVSVCGRLILAGFSDQWRLPRGSGGTADGKAIRLPAPRRTRAAARDLGRSRRAWWSGRSAQQPHRSDQREIW